MLGCIWPTVCRPTISLANPSGEMGNGRGINHTRYLPQLAIKFIVQIIDDVGQYILDEISQRLVGFLVHPRQTSTIYTVLQPHAATDSTVVGECLLELVNVVSKEVYVVVGVSGHRRCNVTVKGDFQPRHCLDVGFQDIGGVITVDSPVLVALVVDEIRGVNYVGG